MTRIGAYRPDDPRHTSNLFIYREVPVQSAKLNRWNGNIAAAFDLLHRVCVALFTRGEAAVITPSGVDALRVVANDPPDRTACVLPGWAILHGGFTGITETERLPEGGELSPPVTHDRIDLIALLDNGDLEIIQGEESVEPISPLTPEGAIPLARVHLRVGGDVILNEDDFMNSYIVDARPRLVMGDAHRHAPDHAPLETPDGLRTSFSTARVFREESLMVFRNGVLQQRGADYEEAAERFGYVFTHAPRAGDSIQHRYLIEHEVE